MIFFKINLFSKLYREYQSVKQFGSRKGSLNCVQTVAKIISRSISSFYQRAAKFTTVDTILINKLLLQSASIFHVSNLPEDNSQEISSLSFTPYWS